MTKDSSANIASAPCVITFDGRFRQRACFFVANIRIEIDVSFGKDFFKHTHTPPCFRHSINPLVTFFCNFSRNLASFEKGTNGLCMHYNLDTCSLFTYLLTYLFLILAYFIVRVKYLENVAGFGWKTLRWSLASLSVVGAIGGAGFRKEVEMCRHEPRGPRVFRLEMAW